MDEFSELKTCDGSDEDRVGDDTLLTSVLRLLKHVLRLSAVEDSGLSGTRRYSSSVYGYTLLFLNELVLLFFRRFRRQQINLEKQLDLSAGLRSVVCCS